MFQTYDTVLFVSILHNPVFTNRNMMFHKSLTISKISVRDTFRIHKRTDICYPGMTKTKQIICHCVSTVKACRYDRIYDFFIVIVKIHKHHWEFLITIQHLQIFLSGSAYNDNTIYSFFLQKLRWLQSLLCMRVNDFKHCKAVLLYRSRCKLLIHFPVK